VIRDEKLPSGWTWTTVAEVIEQRIDQGGPISSDSFMYVDISSIDNRTKRITDPKQLAVSDAPSRARQRIAPSDVLMSMTRPNLNAVALVPEELRGSIASTGFCVLRPAMIESRWLYYLVQSTHFVDVMSLLVQGALYPAVRPKDIHAYPLPLAPLAEQRRIVAEIETQLTRLDAAVAALERTRANLKRYRAAVLKAACEGRLVPTEAELAQAEGREYEPAELLIQRAEQARHGKAGRRGKGDAAGLNGGGRTLPAGWTWATMPLLGELNRGKSKHRPRNDPRLLGGPYPFIQTGDVRNSGGWIRSHSQTYSEFGLAQSRLWPAGTLCITIAANIAETGILTYPACFPDSVVGFRHEGDPTTVRFTEFFLRTARQDLEQYAPATAQKNINLDVLSDVLIPLPPLAEQHRIVAEVERRLSVVEEMERAVEHGLKRAGRLRQAILRKAFAGELVPQDPNDEPASVLLEQIRAERIAQDGKTGRRRDGKGRERNAVKQVEMSFSPPGADGPGSR
jgi:type I restriction enzyme, S subunit